MRYISTRDKEARGVSSAYAIKTGLAADKGLFMPEYIPAITLEEIKSLIPMSYPERAAYVLSKYLDDYSEKELLEDVVFGTFNPDITAYADKNYPDMLRSASIPEVLAFYLLCSYGIDVDEDFFKYEALLKTDPAYKKNIVDENNSLAKNLSLYKFSKLAERVLRLQLRFRLRQLKLHCNMELVFQDFLV